MKTETEKVLAENCAMAKEELDRVVRLLGRFRNYAADNAVWAGGAHHNPIWAEVSDTLSYHGL